MIKFSLISFILVAVTQQTLAIPVGEWDIAFFDDVIHINNATVNANASDEEVSKQLGISTEFLQELKLNLEKAIFAEKQKDVERLRQGFQQGGNVGDFFGVGGGNNGNNQGGGGGQGQGGEEEDEEEEEAGPTTLGPGAAGILTGLFGIFSGLGSLNPQRVIQSTVNFFPPDRRVLAQMALEMAFPTINETTTLRPLTNAPSRRKTTAVPTAVLNSTATTPITTIWPQIQVSSVATESSKSKTTPKKKLILKETSLIEDFDEAVDIFKPSSNQEGIHNVASSLEKDFADTADKFKIESLLSSEVEKEREKENVKASGIAKDFLDTLLLF